MEPVRHPARFLEGDRTSDLLRADHGFSCLVTMTKANRTTKIRFDAGVTPDEPSFLLDGSLLVTGEVDRTTDFEQGFPVHQAYRNGSWQPDPLILDDQALVAHVRGRGLVILTGCGHSGCELSTPGSS